MEKVNDNKAKQKTYAVSYAQYEKALKYGFYIEGVSIGYALIEDRLISFLHYAGVVSRNNENLAINKRIYPYLRLLLNESENYVIRIRDISVKIRIINALLEMTEEDAVRIDCAIANNDKVRKLRNIGSHGGYMLNIYKQIDKSVNRKSVMVDLAEVEQWRATRNQLIHALLSKTVESSQEARKECAYYGYDLGRNIDNDLVKPFKRNNVIRKKYNIQ